MRQAVEINFGSIEEIVENLIYSRVVYILFMQ